MLAGLLLLLAAALAPAAPAPGASASPAPAPAMRVFEIRYRDASEVSILVQPALSPDAVLTVNRALRTVTVVDRPEVVRQVEEFIARFDVPPHAALVRIVLEKAERKAPAGETVDVATAEWTYRPLAETAFEVLERSELTQVFGPSDTYEIHVKLDSVDLERKLLHFTEFAVARRAESSEPGAPAARRDILRTSLDLQDRVGKVVMAARDPRADEALVLRVVGLVREPRPEAR